MQWPFLCLEGSFPDSHPIRGLLYSGLCPQASSDVSVKRQPVALLSLLSLHQGAAAPWLRTVFVQCLPPLLERLLPEDSDFVLVTGVPSVPGTQQAFSKYLLRE